MVNTPDRELIGQAFSRSKDIGVSLYRLPDTSKSERIETEGYWPSRFPDGALEVSASLLRPYTRWRESLEGQIAFFIGPFGNHFSKMTPEGLAVAESLGYGYKETIDTAGDRTEKRVEFTYPSIATLNDQIARRLPGSAIRFAQFPAGSYTGVEYMQSLQKGEVLVGTAQPYRAHDHGVLHVPGWLAGLGGRFADHLKEAITPYITAAQEESNARLLDMVAVNLDLFSSKIGDFLFTTPHPRSAVMNETVNFFDVESYNSQMDKRTKRKFPQYPIGEPTIGRIVDLVENIMNRYYSLQSA